MKNLSIVIAVLLTLVSFSRSFGADLNDRDPWVTPGYLTVETADGWHYVFHNGSNGVERVASYCHANTDCGTHEAGPEIADITNSYTPSSWIDEADGYAYEFLEDGSGVIYSEDSQYEAQIARFCMAYALCDETTSWPFPMSHEEEISPRLFLPFIAG